MTGQEQPERCKCRENRPGGNICHSNDGCECQLFGDFNDPVFCGQDELEELRQQHTKCESRPCETCWAEGSLRTGKSDCVGCEYYHCPAKVSDEQIKTEEELSHERTEDDDY